MFLSFFMLVFTTVLLTLSIFTVYVRLLRVILNINQSIMHAMRPNSCIHVKISFSLSFRR